MSNVNECPKMTADEILEALRADPEAAEWLALLDLETRVRRDPAKIAAFFVRAMECATRDPEDQRVSMDRREHSLWLSLSDQAECMVKLLREQLFEGERVMDDDDIRAELAKYDRRRAEALAEVKALADARHREFRADANERIAEIAAMMDAKR